MTNRWADFKTNNVRSISEGEKRELTELARLTSLLSQRRRMLGLTQGEVAERAGLTQANIARIENARMVPRMDTLIRIARALDLQVGFFPAEAHEEAATSLSL